jgi:hypothetical protein
LTFQREAARGRRHREIAGRSRPVQQKQRGQPLRIRQDQERRGRQQQGRIELDRHVVKKVERQDVGHDRPADQGAQQSGATEKQQHAAENLGRSGEHGVALRGSHEGPQQAHRRKTAERADQLVVGDGRELAREDLAETIEKHDVSEPVAQVDVEAVDPPGMDLAPPVEGRPQDGGAGREGQQAQQQDPVMGHVAAAGEADRHRLGEPQNMLADPRGHLVPGGPIGVLDRLRSRNWAQGQGQEGGDQKAEKEPESGQ